MHISDTYQLLLDSANKLGRSKISIYVGMSGGVDSSVVAYLLKNEGFNVKGIYMQCWGKNDPKCKAHKDRSDAVKVASQLNIPIEIWDLEQEYQQLVIEYFYKEYEEGRTPNPDVLCNSKIKFDLFLTKALEEGADFIATGHYAKIVNFSEFKINNAKLIINDEYNEDRVNDVGSANNSKFSPNIQYTKYNIPYTSFLASGSDMLKDQSYFLSQVKSNVLSKIIFPLGNVYKKSNVGEISTREVARKIGLANADKKDSTGICFLEGIVVQDFLKKRFSEKKGDVLNEQGQKIGIHKGAYFYTVGQRKDFEISVYHGEPLYVLSKNTKNNIIIVGSKKSLQKNEIELQDCAFRFEFEQLSQIIEREGLYVRIRNLGEFVKINSLCITEKKATLRLAKPLESVAPGQFAVLYYFEPTSDERLIVGSGVID